jgi:hypothetical protein
MKMNMQETIRLVKETQLVEKVLRGKTWTIEDPQVGSIVVEEDNGFGSGRIQSFVVTKVERNKKGEARTIQINKIVSINDDLATFDNQSALSIKILKPYFNKKHQPRGVWYHGQVTHAISELTWDRYQERNEGYMK